MFLCDRGNIVQELNNNLRILRVFFFFLNDPAPPDFPPFPPPAPLPFSPGDPPGAARGGPPPRGGGRPPAVGLRGRQLQQAWPDDRRVGHLPVAPDGYDDAAVTLF